ncbi:MAG: peptide chain release factor 2 [Deferrisomatales bacterium]|nr:peptide chain release factor 2 [Deferrisomatales bacterium]
MFDLGGKEKRAAELDDQMARPDFWDDPERATQVSRERNQARAAVDAWKALRTALDDCEVALELVAEEDDPELESETEARLAEVEKGVRGIEFHKMLSGPRDPGNAILAINAGAGGTEAQDWAEMLLRMYLRWAEKRGYEAEVVDLQPGEEAGLKSATVTVEGDYAYGYLKAEQGVHRLVRISPFDSQARRHTSFSSVAVYPEAEEAEEIEIDPKDLRVDLYRSSGAGGQHVNKTDSAIRLTHLPTGIVVACQNERSQHKNRATAMRILRARLLEAQRLEREREMQAQEAEKMEIAWGSQIRSYVLQPYQKIKDHRTDLEEGNVQRVLDGDLDAFIEGFLLFTAEAEAGRA